MARKRKSNPPGFSYYIDDEKLIEFSKWTLKEKLAWLDEINEFMSRFQSRKAAKIMELFKSGKI